MNDGELARLRRVPRQLALITVPSRRCSLCGRPLGRPDPSCARCQLRRDPPAAAPSDLELEPRDVAEAAKAAARLERLRGLGRRIRVGLVGCSESKRDGLHRARDLYTGGYFLRALPIAERTCDEVWILSARYGLLHTERRIPKYNEQLPTRRKECAAWGLPVITSLCNAYPDLPLHLVFLAGGPYVEGVTGIDQRTGALASFNALAIGHHDWTYETPLKGCDRAARWAWFTAQESPPGEGKTGRSSPPRWPRSRQRRPVRGSHTGS